MSLKERLRGIAFGAAAASVTLAIAPAAALAAPIPGNSVTISNLESGDDVTLYQIVATDVDEQNVASNSFVTNFGVDMETEWTEANKEAAANTIALYVNENADDWGIDPGDHLMYTGEATDSTLTITGVDAGQYLVVVTSDNDATRVYQNTIVTVEPSIVDGEFVPNTDLEGDDANTVKLKYTDMNPDDNDSIVDKKINDDDAVDDVDRDDKVTFTITTPVPRYTSTNDRTFVLTDSMSAGFAYAGNLVVGVAESPDRLVQNVDYTLGSSEGFFQSITLTPSGLSKVGGSTLSVSYDATLTDEARYDQAESNKVVLTFSLNSYGTETGTDDDIVYMTVYGVTFTKVNEAGDALQGATFAIKDGDTTLYENLTTGSNGVIEVPGALAAGTEYTLVETSAPAGYKPIAELQFTIDSGSDNDGNGVKDGYLYEINDGTIVDEENDIFSELPETGGTGTVALTVVGVGLMAGAAYLVVRSRREN